MNQHTRCGKFLRCALIEVAAVLEQLATGATLVRTAYEMHLAPFNLWRVGASVTTPSRTRTKKSIYRLFNITI